MAVIAPLRPLHFAPENLATLVAPPYDVISPEERAALAARDPHNVVKLILPEGEGDAKYAHAAELVAAWRKEGALTRDDRPQFLRYDQRFTLPDGRAGAGRGTLTTIHRRGFLGLVKVVPLADPSAGPHERVLPHERTLSGPKEDRLKLFRATRTNLSPGFLLYKDPGQKLASALERAEPVARFTTPDGIDHELTRIVDPAAVAALIAGVADSALLIADGHHRYETALRYRDEARAAATAAGAELPADAEPNYFMAFFANEDDPGLVVLPTHRHLHDLAVDKARFESSAAEHFTITPLAQGAEASALVQTLADSGAKTPSIVAAYPDGSATLLALKMKIADLAAHPTLGHLNPQLRGADVALLHSALLEQIIGLTKEAQAAKTNLWYPQDAAASLKKLRSGGGAGESGTALFLMNATPAAVVRNVAEAGEVMPQKSTFFYPKVLTGLAMHTLEPDRTVG
jgi:uncharacterized protein (DUF1015 family)